MTDSSEVQLKTDQIIDRVAEALWRGEAEKCGLPRKVPWDEATQCDREKWRYLSIISINANAPDAYLDGYNRGVRDILALSRY